MSLISEGAKFARPASSAAASCRHEPSIAGVGDYLALMKPRVMSLVIFTALVGMMIAPGQIHPVIGFVALACISVGAGAAGALNMWYDADIDAVMRRTAGRPIPRGRIAPGEALGFGVTLAGFSVAVLGLLVNWFAAAMLAFTIFFYIVVYTMWLKRWTPQNIVIGGAAGAFPPIIGWAAATGGISRRDLRNNGGLGGRRDDRTRAAAAMASRRQASRSRGMAAVRVLYPLSLHVVRSAVARRRLRSPFCRSWSLRAMVTIWTANPEKSSLPRSKNALGAPARSPLPWRLGPWSCCFMSSSW
jgi:uncharacterized membrane protein